MMKYKINNILPLVFATGTLVCAGCKSDEPEPPKEYCSIPMYMAGQAIPSASQEKVMFNPVVKMYSVGRRLDPATGTMNEACTFYRMEQEPEWNLVPQYDMNHETFARQMKQEAYADILAGQVKNALHHTQSVSKQMKTMETEILLLEKDKRALQAELEKREAEVRKLTESMRALRDYISVVDAKVANLKPQNGRKDASQSPEPAEPPAEESAAPSQPPSGNDIIQRRRSGRK